MTFFWQKNLFKYEIWISDLSIFFFFGFLFRTIYSTNHALWLEWRSLQSDWHATCHPGNLWVFTDSACNINTCVIYDINRLLCFFCCCCFLCKLNSRSTNTPLNNERSTWCAESENFPAAICLDFSLHSVTATLRQFIKSKKFLGSCTPDEMN